jgi:hypothetical protein
MTFSYKHVDIAPIKKTKNTTKASFFYVADSINLHSKKDLLLSIKEPVTLRKREIKAKITNSEQLILLALPKPRFIVGRVEHSRL